MPQLQRRETSFQKALREGWGAFAILQRKQWRLRTIPSASRKWDPTARSGTSSATRNKIPIARAAFKAAIEQYPKDGMRLRNRAPAEKTSIVTPPAPAATPESVLEENGMEQKPAHTGPVIAASSGDARVRHPEVDISIPALMANE